MIKNEDLNKIVEDCRIEGINVTVRDISFSLLCRFFEDKKVAYKIAFGILGVISDMDFEAYEKSKEIAFLNNYMDSNYQSQPKKKKGKNGEDISFDENKAEIIKLLQETKDKEAKGELDAKQSLDLQTKLRIALNDKFQVNNEVKDQIVQVSQKYDAVCPYCSHEVASRPMSKEEAMKMYNLIENNNNEQA